MYNDYRTCFDPRPGRVNSLAPGKTRWTMITPAIVFDGGKLRAVVGAPGGTKIVTGVLQALVNLLDHGMTTVEAVSAPRIDHQGEVVTAEERLRYYAQQFPVVEVDATYYALPREQQSELWAERTPDDFVFDIKAHALMTGQPTEVKRLPKSIRDELPEKLAEKPRIYGKD